MRRGNQKRELAWLKKSGHYYFRVLADVSVGLTTVRRSTPFPLPVFFGRFCRSSSPQYRRSGEINFKKQNAREGLKWLKKMLWGRWTGPAEIADDDGIQNRRRRMVAQSSTIQTLETIYPSYNIETTSKNRLIKKIKNYENLLNREEGARPRVKGRASG